MNKITDTGVCAKNADGDIEFAADSVVYATGSKALNKEAHALYNCANEFFIVGDCLTPKNIMHATHTAFQAAYDIGTIK